MKIKFADNFSFGAATSGPQSEGNIEMSKTVWDKYTEEDICGFDQNIGVKVTSDTYRRYKEDVSLAKDISLSSLRTSIQYARLFDDMEKQTINQKGYEFYLDYFKSLKEAGVEVYMNLFHFDMPLELFEKYEGFMSKEVVDLYASYAKKCFELFGDYVDKWITFNEPFSYASSMYLHNAALPLEHNMQKFATVCLNINICHKKMVKEFKALNLDSQIGTVLDCLPPYPRDKNHVGDLKASKNADLIKNINFLDPVIKCEFSEEYLQLIEDCGYTLEISEEELDLVSKYDVDFVGINYYRPERVKCVDFVKNPDIPYSPDHLFENFVQPKRRVNPHRGWEIYPKALYDVAMRMKNEYGNIPWYVAENGIGVANEEQYKDENGMIVDDYRIEFLTEHFYYLHKAIEEGSNCFAFHMWTYIDCWSWKNAYKTRYGFISLDLATRERTIKKSGYWIKDVIETREIDVTSVFKYD